jgi:hypothetical protein
MVRLIVFSSPQTFRLRNFRIQSLPPEIQFTGPAACLVGKYEHHFALRMRYVYICSLLYRPFLYLAVHCSSPGSLPDPVKILARKAVHHAFAMNDEIGIHYRYEGTWATCRLAGANILTLFAAQKAGLITEETLLAMGHEPTDLTTAIEMNERRIDYWASESPDLKMLAKAIEERLNLVFRSP